MSIKIYFLYQAYAIADMYSKYRDIKWHVILHEMFWFCCVFVVFFYSPIQYLTKIVTFRCRYERTHNSNVWKSQWWAVRIISVFLLVFKSVVKSPFDAGELGNKIYTSLRVNFLHGTALCNNYYMTYLSPNNFLSYWWVLSAQDDRNLPAKADK